MSNIDERKNAIDDLIAKAKDAIEKGDIETAKSLKAEIDTANKEYEELQQLTAEISDLVPGTKDDPEMTESAEITDNQVKGVEEEPKEEPKEDAPKEDASKEDAPKEDQPSDEAESESDTKDTEDKKEDSPFPPKKDDDDEDIKKKKEGAKRSMKINKELENNEYVEAFADYMTTRGAKRSGIISDDVGVTIPEDIKYQPEKEVNTVQDLSELVQKTSVKTASGKYPILKRANAKFNTVAELEENPELAKPEFQTVNWEVATYRGAIPVSQESLDDSVANLTAIISENIQEQKINTLNEKIGTVLKAFAPTSISSVDDLKEIINVKLDPGYDRQIICTQSFYQILDTLKDGNGRYLLQDSIINTAGNTVLGMNVTVVRDELLGAAGEAKAFIGDIKRGVLFADRTDVSVQWIENNIYGKYLMGAFRFDVKQADKNAGYFVTFETETAPTAP